MKLNDRGLLVVISGPSGVGKSSVRKALFELDHHSLVYSISMTTRPIRKGEKNGVDYYFVSEKEFKKKIEQDLFLEWAEFCGNYYGTPKEAVDKLLDEGKEVILEIDVAGALQVRNKVKDAVFIFIVPPTSNAIEERLRKRGSDNKDTIKLRLAKAKAEYELAYKYDYIVVNDEIYNAADRIMAIIRAEHAKTQRSIHNYFDLLNQDKEKSDKNEK